jgi:predicted acylesterase/phospholipase RssA
LYDGVICNGSARALLVLSKGGVFGYSHIGSPDRMLPIC